MSKDKEGHFITLMMGSAFRRHHSPNCVTEFQNTERKKLKELKGKTDKCTITIGEFNTKKYL